MKRHAIERDILGIGTFNQEQLGDATETSNKALSELAPRVQWEHSYVTGNKTFCIYLAEDEQAIRDHSLKSGFPANVITEVTGIIDPTTTNG